MKMLSALLLCSFLFLVFPVMSQSPEPTATISVDYKDQSGNAINSVEVKKDEVAQVVPAAMELPSVAISVAQSIAAMPKIGPVFVSIIKWLAVIVSIFNVLIAVIFALIKIPEIGLRMIGFAKFADKLKVFYDKIYPYLAWPSILNSKLGK